MGPEERNSNNEYPNHLPAGPATESSTTKTLQYKTQYSTNILLNTDVSVNVIIRVTCVMQCRSVDVSLLSKSNVNVSRQPVFVSITTKSLLCSASDLASRTMSSAICSQQPQNNNKRVFVCVSTTKISSLSSQRLPLQDHFQLTWVYWKCSLLKRCFCV